MGNKVVTVKLVADTKGAVKNVDKLDKSIKKTEKSTIDTKEQLNALSGGAIGRFGALKNQVLNLVKSFKALKFAIAATGVGALVIAVVALVQAFKSSEDGQNKWTKWFNRISVVIGNVTDILSDFGNVIINVFTGNFDEARKAMDDVTNGIKNFGEETMREIALMDELSDKRARADKLERSLIVERAEANRKVAELRERAADKENVTVQERIAALTEASKIEEEITNKEIEAARIRFETKQQENKLSNSTKEDLNEEAQLKAALIELETGRLRRQKALTAEITTALREEESERKAIESERKARIAERNKQQEEDYQKELARIKALEDAKLKTEQDELQREEQQWNMLQRIRNSALENELLDLAQQYDRKFELANGNNELEQALQEEHLQKQFEIEEKYNRKTKAATEKTNAEIKANEEATVQSRMMMQQALVNATSSALGQIAILAGEGTKLAKVAAIADIIIGTGIGFIQGLDIAQKSAKATGPAAALSFPIFYATQIAAVLSAANKARTILAKAKGPELPSIAGPTGIGGGGLTSPSTAPEFNIVGQSGFNQIAGALGQQPPVQAYVVAGNVTTAQQLQNNTIQQATF